MAAPISSNAGASETGTSRCAAGPCAPHAAASCVAGSTLLKSAKSYLSPRDLTSRSPRPIKRFSSKFTLRLSSKFREENMENQVISTFGSAIWILVQVACIAFTAFCAILLGALQLDHSNGAHVQPRAPDWSVRDRQTAVEGKLLYVQVGSGV